MVYSAGQNIVGSFFWSYSLFSAPLSCHGSSSKTSGGPTSWRSGTLGWREGWSNSLPPTHPHTTPNPKPQLIRSGVLYDATIRVMRLNRRSVQRSAVFFRETKRRTVKVSRSNDYGIVLFFSIYHQAMFLIDSFTPEEKLSRDLLKERET